MKRKSSAEGGDKMGFPTRRGGAKEVEPREMKCKGRINGLGITVNIPI